MNQVTELLRLVPGASIEDAVVRLSTLFDLMTTAKGFRTAEILRKTDEHDLVLVLHTWDDIDDWHAFRSSETKMTFAAARPDFLYQFVPCGINWLPQQSEGPEETMDGDYVRRELIRDAALPMTGPNVITSRTFSYRDYEPSLCGVALRLTRLHSIPSAVPAPGEPVLADELYESLKKHSVLPINATTAIARQVDLAR